MERDRVIGVRFEFLDLLRSVSVVTFFPRRFIIVGVLIFAGDTFHVITARSALMILFTASPVRRTPFEIIIIVIVVPHRCFSTVWSGPLRLLLLSEWKINKLGFSYCSLFIHISRGYGVVRELERGLMSKQASC